MVMMLRFASQPASMHSRQHVVRWSDDYCEEKMRPYPADKRLIVVRANMGIGESEDEQSV
jgi:hypothetical protein